MTYGKQVSNEIAALEQEIHDGVQRLAALKRAEPREPVRDYELADRGGPVHLGKLFGDKSDLIVIHNMGESCPYCMLWADGFNGLYPHLADRAGFALVSPDEIGAMQAFADSRGWRFPVVSAASSTFIADMGFDDGGAMPGMSTFRRTEAGGIERVASAPFGPFDPFCSAWHLFSLLADGVGEWGPSPDYGD